MDKYKKLVSNAIVVGIGNFSSKFLVFLLMPITTRALSTAEYGTADLAVQAANLLYPFMSLGIAKAVLRFGLDSNEEKADVFTSGILTALAGFTLLLLAAPLFSHVSYISENILLIYLYVFFSTMHIICANFVRADQKIKLYAIDGILCTVLVFIFTILFLVVFKMGVTGYLLAVIVSNAVSCLFLSAAARLRQYIRIKGLHRNTFVQMLKYSVPLIPTILFWWITSVSDRFLVTYMISDAANGLYAAANKAPQMIVIISTIFSDAWLISALHDSNHADRQEFFTKVFKSYQAIVFVAASGLIMCTQLVTRLLVADAFFDSWRYVPVLILATVFSCFVTFLQSVYFVEKKSMLLLVTIMAGALTNIALNFFLIPNFGIYGAAISTVVCYAVVFIFRAVNTKKYINIQMSIGTLAANLLIISAQSCIIILGTKDWVIFEIALFAAVVLLNGKTLLRSLRKLAKA